MSNTTNSTVESPDYIISDHSSNDVNEDVNYLVVTFCSLIVIVILTIIVVMLLRRKRKIDRLRHHLMPLYNFAPGEEEDWETELLDADVREGHTRRDYNSIISYYQEQHPM